MAPPEPYTRRRYAMALGANAAVKPFNLAVLVGTVGAGLLVGGRVALVVAVGVVVYAIACGLTFFDETEADAVLKRERRDRRRARRRRDEELDLGRLAPAIRAHVVTARVGEQRIRTAIERAELPYGEVSDEVDGFVREMELTAVRAQMLHEALADAPPERIRARLAAVQDDPARSDLAEALRHQLEVQERMAGQLQRFHDEMERMAVELDTVRGSLLSVSASTDAAGQRRLAGEVRDLRAQMGAVAEGMTAVYESN